MFVAAVPGDNGSSQPHRSNFRASKKATINSCLGWILATPLRRSIPTDTRLRHYRVILLGPTRCPHVEAEPFTSFKAKSVLEVGHRLRFLRGPFFGRSGAAIGCSLGRYIIFPNLFFAISQQRLTHYRFCDGVKIDPTRFSRCLNGRLDFSASEKERIAEALAYPSDWLFQEIKPPPQVSSVKKREMVEAS